MNNIFVYRGNIINCDAECIVNPANNSLMSGNGVNRAIFYSAGEELYNYCHNIGNCDTGKAVATPGFNIPVKHIIHTVGPYWHGGYDGEAVKLTSCYIESMKLALELGVKSIAFPAISVGNGRYPVREAAEIAICSVKSFLDNHEDVDMDVIFMCYTDDVLIKYRNANMSTEIDILKYLKRKEIHVNKELNKDERSIARPSFIKKTRTQEQIDRTVYSVLKRVTLKRKDLILLSAKMTTEKISGRTCDKHHGRTGPYVTLDTVSDVEIEDKKVGPFLIPQKISFVIHPFAYKKEEIALLVEQQEKDMIDDPNNSTEDNTPEKMYDIENELRGLTNELKSRVPDITSAQKEKLALENNFEDHRFISDEIEDEPQQKGKKPNKDKKAKEKSKKKK